MITTTALARILAHYPDTTPARALDLALTYRWDARIVDAPSSAHAALRIRRIIEAI